MNRAIRSRLEIKRARVLRVCCRRMVTDDDVMMKVHDVAQHEALQRRLPLRRGLRLQRDAGVQLHLRGGLRAGLAELVRRRHPQDGLLALDRLLGHAAAGLRVCLRPDGGAGDGVPGLRDDRVQAEPAERARDHLGAGLLEGGQHVLLHGRPHLGGLPPGPPLRRGQGCPLHHVRSLLALAATDSSTPSSTSHVLFGVASLSCGRGDRARRVAVRASSPSSFVGRPLLLLLLVRRRPRQYPAPRPAPPSRSLARARPMPDDDADGRFSR